MASSAKILGKFPAKSVLHQAQLLSKCPDDIQAFRAFLRRQLHNEISQLIGGAKLRTAYNILQ